jgi:hypothetical protein
VYQTGGLMKKICKPRFGFNGSEEESNLRVEDVAQNEIKLNFRKSILGSVGKELKIDRSANRYFYPVT